MLAWSARAETPFAPLTPGDQSQLVIPYKDETGLEKNVDPKGQKLTAVHFWATWCVPCLAELPEVDATANAYGTKGLQVVTISLDTRVDKVKTFFAEKKITHLPAYLDSNNAAFRIVKLKGLPGTIFFNADGKVIGRVDGPLDWKSKTTTDFIEQALK